MKFRVTGQNRDTGARMILEFESESRAAAERKALQQGMLVNRVEDITDGHAPKSHGPHPRAGRWQKSQKRRRMLIIIILIVVVTIAWFFGSEIIQRL